VRHQLGHRRRVRIGDVDHRDALLLIGDEQSLAGHRHAERDGGALFHEREAGGLDRVRGIRHVDHVHVPEQIGVLTDERAITRDRDAGHQAGERLALADQPAVPPDRQPRPDRHIRQIAGQDHGAGGAACLLALDRNDAAAVGWRRCSVGRSTDRAQVVAARRGQEQTEKRQARFHDGLHHRARDRGSRKGYSKRAVLGSSQRRKSNPASWAPAATAMTPSRPTSPVSGPDTAMLHAPQMLLADMYAVN